VIVLDEPTNDLDLPSLRMLEEALADFEGSVLVVSHDRYFLDRICDQIVAFEDGGGVLVQPGNYSYYLEKKLERDAQGRRLSAALTSAPAAPATAPKARKRSFKEQRELEGMEAVILVAESRVAELEETLDDPAFYVTRSQDAPGIVAELEGAKAEVARLYSRWEELERLGI
jgi:ABC transport system ATP-binding/permease protein